MMDRLTEAIAEKKNPTALRLEPAPEKLPASFLARYDTGTLMGLCGALLAANKALLEGLREIVPCVILRPEAYLCYGVPGCAILEQTMAFAREKGYLTVVDSGAPATGILAAAYWTEVRVGGRTLRAPSADLVVVSDDKPEETFTEACRRCRKGAFLRGAEAEARLRELTLQPGESEDWGVVAGREGPALRSFLPEAFLLIRPDSPAEVPSGPFLAEDDGGLLEAWKKWDTEDFVTAAREEAYRFREMLTEDRPDSLSTMYGRGLR